ncbi:MAG: hypothetical protein QM775_29110 [Pirellulales bacterium]
MSSDTRDVFFNLNPNAYALCWDNEWAKQVADLAERTALHDAAFDLHLDWRSTLLVSSMPNVYIRSLDQMWKAVYEKANPYEMAGQIAGSILNYLFRKIPSLKVNEIELRKHIEGYSAELTKLEPKETPFNAEEQWMFLVENHDFIGSIIGSQRMSYSALYFSYENYIRHVVQIVKGEPEYKANTPQLAKDLTTLFDHRTTQRLLYGDIATG